MAFGAFFGAVPLGHHGVQGMFHLSPLGLMASEADAWPYRVPRNMDVMAVGAAHSTHVVRAAAPICVTFIFFMANQAGAALFCWSGTPFLERLDLKRPQVIFLTSNFFVRRPPAVARLTTGLRIAAKRTAMHAVLESPHGYLVATKTLYVINASPIICPCVGQLHGGKHRQPDCNKGIFHAGFILMPISK